MIDGGSLRRTSSSTRMAHEDAVPSCQVCPRSFSHTLNRYRMLSCTWISRSAHTARRGNSQNRARIWRQRSTESATPAGANMK